MTISIEFECGKLPKKKNIVSNLESLGYAVTDESRQTLLIIKTFQDGKRIFNKNKILLKINLNIFFLLAVSLLASLYLLPFLPSIKIRHGRHIDLLLPYRNLHNEHARDL